MHRGWSGRSFELWGHGTALQEKGWGVGAGSALPPLFSLTSICQNSPLARCHWTPKKRGSPLLQTCNPSQRGAPSCVPSKHSGNNARFSSGNCLPTLLPCNLNKNDGLAGFGEESHKIQACLNTAFQASDYTHWFRGR